MTQTLSEAVEDGSSYITEIIAIIGVLAFFYLLFCLYLLIYVAIAMGASCLNKCSVCIEKIEH